MLLRRRVCSELPEPGEKQLENRRTIGLAVADREIDGRRFPSNGRLTTDQGSRFFAYVGISANPRVDATREMAIARLSTP